MGLFSWDCRGCGHPLLSGYALEEDAVNEWMTKAVAMLPDGTRAIGEYDGYGRIGEFDVQNAGGEPCCYHKACWELMEKPGYNQPSNCSDDQGYFFDNEHDMPCPQTVQDVADAQCDSGDELNLVQHTLAEYKSRYDELRRLSNQSWEKTFSQVCPHCKQSIPAADHTEQFHKDTVAKLQIQEGELKREMLEDEKVSFLVCNAAVSWQAKSGESNYDLDQRFAKKFPMAVTDSEQGQGWGHINTRYIEEVRQYMSEVEGLVENGDQNEGIFSISTDIEDDEQSNLNDHYYRDHLTVQWNWKESEISV